MVVLIHSTTYMAEPGIGNFYNYYFIRRILNFAVIFFFAATGYFISQHKDYKKIMKSTKKIFNMYIFSSLLYLGLRTVLFLLDYLRDGKPFIKSVISMFRNISIVSIVNGTFGSYHFWYLASLMICLIIFYYLIKNNASTVTVVTVSILFFLSYRLNWFDYGELTRYGGFPTAIISMMIGYVAAEMGPNIKFSKFLSLMSICIYSILLYKEFVLLSEVFFYGSVFFAILYCKFNPGKESALSRMGNESLYIYIMHEFIVKIFLFLFSFYSVEFHKYQPIISVSCIILSILLSKPMYNIMFNIYDTLFKKVFQIKTDSNIKNSL